MAFGSWAKKINSNDWIKKQENKKIDMDEWIRHEAQASLIKPGELLNISGSLIDKKPTIPAFLKQ